MSALWLYLALTAAGIAAGFVNVVAGGGSMLTLPALMLLGMPADIANGTNRLAIVTQSVSGLIGFHQHGKLDSKTVLPVVLPTTLGAGAGALVAASVPASMLEYVLLGTMTLVAALMALAPTLVSAPPNSQPNATKASKHRRLASIAGLLAAGFYGGFVQAGVGFLLLAVLGGLLRMDLTRANALKLACTGVFSVVALGIFVAAGDVLWLPGTVLAAATFIGAQLGVRFAVKVRQDVLRWIIFACVVATCAAALAQR